MQWIYWSALMIQSMSILPFTSDEHVFWKLYRRCSSCLYYYLQSLWEGYDIYRWSIWNIYIYTHIYRNRYLIWFELLEVGFSFWCPLLHPLFLFICVLVHPHTHCCFFHIMSCVSDELKMTSSLHFMLYVGIINKKSRTLQMKGFSSCIFLKPFQRCIFQRSYSGCKPSFWLTSYTKQIRLLFLCLFFFPSRF